MNLDPLALLLKPMFQSSFPWDECHFLWQIAAALVLCDEGKRRKVAWFLARVRAINPETTSTRVELLLHMIRVIAVRCHNWNTLWSFSVFNNNTKLAICIALFSMRVTGNFSPFCSLHEIAVVNLIPVKRALLALPKWAPATDWPTGDNKSLFKGAFTWNLLVERSKKKAPSCVGCNSLPVIVCNSLSSSHSLLMFVFRHFSQFQSAKLVKP